IQHCCHSTFLLPRNGLQFNTDLTAYKRCGKRKTSDTITLFGLDSPGLPEVKLNSLTLVK
ncbi:hypothetical protein, partial [Enterobacter hormaechei]|uniref:hypothetical protein n=1 Tax=Enterobacter hormaechei TaxID=158836 RepID=UPI001CC2A68D